MITIQNIAKSYGDVQAVKDVSFEAKDGEITTLLGANGSGKTTTLRSICGLLNIDQGNILVEGTNVHQDPIEIRKSLGFVPDEFGLYSRLTAREHLDYFAALHGMKGAEKKAAISEILDLLNINDLADRKTDGFSLGERAKVALGRALVYRPKNFILDEPTRGLDVVSIRLLRGLLRNLKDRGHAILFSSHVMAEVAELSDRVVIIADGHVVANETPQAIVKQAGTQNLEDAFVQLTGIEEKEMVA